MDTERSNLIDLDEEEKENLEKRVQSITSIDNEIRETKFT